MSPTSRSPHTVAIVGGGWAGLAAAVELCAAGKQVTVFESARHLGGRARSIDVDGRRLDNGQHILLGAYSETLRLMRKTGVDPKRSLRRLALELSHPAAGFHLKLSRLAAPFNLLLGLLSAQGCSLREKLSAALFMRRLQGDQYRLPADCTVSELLDRHQQQGALRHYLWEPLCLAALNTAARHASAQVFANVLRDSLGGQREATDLLLPVVGLGPLFPEAAGDFIRSHGGRICLSTRIEALEREGDQWRINGEAFAAVILAVAPQHASDLLAGLPEMAPLISEVEHYHFEPIATLYAAYPEQLRLPRPMLGLESSATQRLGQWVFDRGALGDTPGLLAFVLSAGGAWQNLDSKTLHQRLHAELEETLGKPLQAALWHKRICERRASFRCQPGLFRPTPETPVPGLWLAGDYVCADYPATLEGAVRSGVAAARGCCKSASADRKLPPEAA